MLTMFLGIIYVNISYLNTKDTRNIKMSSLKTASLHFPHHQTSKLYAYVILQANKTINHELQASPNALSRQYRTMSFLLFYYD